MPADDGADELRGEIVALETALAAAFGEIAVLRAAVEGGGAEAALDAMEGMAKQLEGSVLRGVVGAEAAGRPAAAAASRAARTPQPTRSGSAPTVTVTRSAWRAPASMTFGPDPKTSTGTLDSPGIGSQVIVLPKPSTS